LATRRAPRTQKYAASSVSRFAFAKNKIRVVPFEGIHQNAVKILSANGYTIVEIHGEVPGAMAPGG
jgi:hypothetical protein